MVPLASRRVAPSARDCRHTESSFQGRRTGPCTHSRVPDEAARRGFTTMHGRHAVSHNGSDLPRGSFGIKEHVSGLYGKLQMDWPHLGHPKRQSLGGCEVAAAVGRSGFCLIPPRAGDLRSGHRLCHTIGKSPASLGGHRIRIGSLLARGMCSAIPHLHGRSGRLRVWGGHLIPHGLG